MTINAFQPFKFFARETLEKMIPDDLLDENGSWNHPRHDNLHIDEYIDGACKKIEIVLFPILRTGGELPVIFAGTSQENDPFQKQEDVVGDKLRTDGYRKNSPDDMNLTKLSSESLV